MDSISSESTVFVQHLKFGDIVQICNSEIKATGSRARPAILRLECVVINIIYSASCTLRRTCASTGSLTQGKVPAVLSTVHANVDLVVRLANRQTLGLTSQERRMWLRKYVPSEMREGLLWCTSVQRLKLSIVPSRLQLFVLDEHLFEPCNHIVAFWICSRHD